MHRLLIVYNSSGGATRRYAQLLASATGGTALPLKEVRAAQLQAADAVVFASWLMAGALRGGGFLRRHWAILRDKRTMLAVVGLRRTLDDAAWDAYAARAFTPEMRGSLQVFYLRGAYSPQARGSLVRHFMRALASQLEKKVSPTPDELALARDIRQGCDYVSADALSALLRCLG
ncbi:MAG: flavodoxin domain-containing protein [Aristaeellaceae bacterium]